MQNTEQRLIEYMREKYDPVAIVLHGSRANGMAREHSDWDLVIFTKQDVKPISREIIFGANMELKQIVLPVPEDKFLGFFFRTENVKILYDPEFVAKSILKQNDILVGAGNKFTDIDRTKRYAFISSSLDGIRDYSDNRLILYDKKIDFYTRIIEAWFRFTRNEFEPSHYFAYPKIKECDPEFYGLIESFVAETEAPNLLLLGNKMLNHLFPDISPNKN